MATKEQFLRALKSLNFESWGYPAYPINGIQKYFDKSVKEDYCHDRDDEMSDLIDDAGQGMALALIFLFDKGYLTEEQVRELVSGQVYNTSAYGDFHKYGEELGMIINPKKEKKV